MFLLFVYGILHLILMGLFMNFLGKSFMRNMHRVIMQLLLFVTYKVPKVGNFNFVLFFFQFSIFFCKMIILMGHKQFWYFI
jgi:hypothetical protein